MKFTARTLALLSAAWGLPARALPNADCAWSIREIIPVSGVITSLAQAEAIAASPGAATVLTYQSDVINRHDPDNPGGDGFFQNDLPFAGNNLTPSGLSGGDDNDFVLSARCAIVVTVESDYTFGFSTNEGARLRVEGAAFLSSTRLNVENPADPAHNGDTLQFPGTTTNADTLGVCHLLPGIHELDFLTWERSGGAFAEVFAAKGAKTAIDESFRLIGHRPSGLVGDNPRITDPGWKVWMRRDGALNLDTALTRMFESWSLAPVVTGLRFTSSPDAPERDPVSFILEGSTTGAANGPWITLGSGSTGLTPARNFSPPPVILPGPVESWQSYRLTFPSIRDRATADSMQIAEVEFLSSGGSDYTAPGDAVLSGSPNFPGGNGPAAVIDNNPATSFRSFDRLNTGFVVTPRARAWPAINFHDPARGGGGHGFPQLPFPGDAPGDDNAFALGARATMLITTPGEYTFCLLSDNGARFRVPRSAGWLVTSGSSASTQPQALPDGMVLNGCCGDVFGTVALEPGFHEIELVYNEVSGPAFAGVWSAYGRRTAFDPVHFGLLSTTPRTTAPDEAPFAILGPSVSSPPKNDNFESAFPVPGLSAHVSGCNTGATLQTDEPRQLLWQNTLWWKWTAPATGIVQVDTAGSEMDTVLAVYVGSLLNALTLVAANDDEKGLRTSKLIFFATAGITYSIQAGGYPGETGSLQLNLQPPAPNPSAPANDAFAAALNLGVSAGFAIEGTTAAATSEPAEPDHWLSNPANARSSVWFRWQAPRDGAYIFDTRGSRFDTVLAIYTGDSVATLTLLGADDQGPDTGDQSRLLLHANANTDYFIAIDGYTTGQSGPFVLSLTAVPSVVTYTMAPAGNLRVSSLRWSSDPLTTFEIQQSPDLKNWTPYTTGFPSAGGVTSIEIPSSLIAPRQFYRVLRE